MAAPDTLDLFLEMSDIFTMQDVAISLGAADITQIPHAAINNVNYMIPIAVRSGF